MKRPIVLIVLFIMAGIFTCIGVGTDTSWLAMLGAIASAIFGTIISMIFESIDTHGQGMKLWMQHIKYWKQDIRLSIAYLFRIEIDGKYLLVKGNRLKKQFQPVGGVYKFYAEAKPNLEKWKYRPDTKMGNVDETDDLRIFIKGRYLLKFMVWFDSMKDREYDPYREFCEELLETNLLPKEPFSRLKYRKVMVHNKGVLHSKIMRCDELVYADIFELDLSAEQKEIIKAAVARNPDMLCLASAEEMISQCYNGIEKNVGNNAEWLIGG